MVSNSKDNVNELEEFGFRYDLQQSHLPPTVWNLSNRLMRQHTKKKCEDKEGSFHTSLELEASWNVMAHAQKTDFVFGETDESISIGGGVSSVDYWQPRCAHQR